MRQDPFDQITEIPELTVNNVGEIPFERMLAILTPYVLVQIPEDSETVDEKRRLDFLLARTANLYAYLRVLWSQATYLRAEKRRDKDDEAESMQKKKEVLYELGNAMKLKYEAVSRKITVLMDGEGEEKVTPQVNYQGRAEAAQTKREEPARLKGWGAVGK